MISATELTLRYAAGAVLATLVNLVTQWLSFHIYFGAGELVLGIAAGTMTGLISKYIFDKFLIFSDQSRKIVENLHKFFLYCITGAFTTAIFCGTEATFAWFSDREAMRFVGAIIGLSVGYVVKFHLDRRFVFRGKL